MISLIFVRKQSNKVFDYILAIENLQIGIPPKVYFLLAMVSVGSWPVVIDVFLVCFSLRIECGHIDILGKQFLARTSSHRIIV